MKSIISILLAGVIAAGCSTPQSSIDSAAADLAAGLCQGSTSPQCRFVNSPVKLVPQGRKLPGRPFEFYPIARQLDFVDGQSRRWVARKNILTDGASIPPIFVSIVGSPRAPEFINAAAVHDAYCGVGNEDAPEYHSRRWEDVHRMFYDALRVGGTPEKRAKLMFAAVYLGGPRWEEPLRKLDDVPTPAMQQGMRQVAGYINTNNPSVAQIEAFIEGLEPGLQQSREPGGNVDGAPQPNKNDGYEGEYDPFGDEGLGDESLGSQDPTLP